VAISVYLRLKRFEFLLIFLVILVSCGKKEAKKDTPPPSPEISKVVLVSSDKGKKIWRLTSNKIELKDKKTYLSDIKLELFDNEETACTVFADNGILDEEKKTISVFSNVIASCKDGILTTSSLIWDEKKRAIYTDNKVLFKKDNILIKGIGFMGDISISSFKIKKDIEVLLKY